jgi:hypothetical protein
MVSPSRRVTSTAPACSHSDWVRGILPSVVSGDLLEAAQELSRPPSRHLLHVQESVVVGREIIGLLTIKEQSY